MMTPLIRKLTPGDYETSVWSGGTTTQLWINPYEASYSDRAFLWRISSAAVEDETSTFTPLPEYERCIATLEGSIVLRHDGGEAIPLDPYQVHRFDGGAVTVSSGRCRDFNLMLRKGQAEGRLEAICLPGSPSPMGLSMANTQPVPDLELSVMPGCEELLLYCAEGTATVMVPKRGSAGLDSFIHLSENEAMILLGEAPSLFVIGTGWLMFAQMKRA